MRPCCLLAACCLLAGAAAGQTVFTNQFGIYPDATSFTSRSAVAGGGTGDLVICVDKDAFRGVGQITAPKSNRVVGTLTGFRAVVQDQNAATRERIDWVILREDARTGGPDTDPRRGVIARSADLTLPAGPPGPRAWQITTTLATPANVIPLADTFYFGVGLDPNSAWSRDGVSVHAASYTAGASGDNPVAGTPTLTWAVNRPANTKVEAAARTHRMHLLVCGGVLNWGADIIAGKRRGPNPSFGVAGSHPDVRSRGDGLAIRLRAAQSRNARYAVYIGRLADTPVVFPFLSGATLLDLRSIAQLGAGRMSATGTALLTPAFIAQGRIPRNIRGPIAAQGVSLITVGSNAGKGAGCGGHVTILK